MLHAGVLMKLGAFGIIRLGFQIMPEGGEFWAPALLTLGIVGALYGAIGALRQTDFKLMTASPRSRTWATCSWASACSTSSG